MRIDSYFDDFRTRRYNGRILLFLMRACTKSNNRGVGGWARPNLPKAALHRAKGQIICPKYWYELKTREPTQETSLDFKDSSINDVYSHTMLKKSSLDSEVVLAVEVETYNKDLGAFSESINESVLHEDYTSGRQNQDDNKIQEPPLLSIQVSELHLIARLHCASSSAPAESMEPLESSTWPPTICLLNRNPPHLTARASPAGPSRTCHGCPAPRFAHANDRESMVYGP